jgi:hypothetical protein
MMKHLLSVLDDIRESAKVLSCELMDGYPMGQRRPVVISKRDSAVRGKTLPFTPWM